MRKRRALGIVFLCVIAGIGLVLMTAFILLESRWGMERVRRFALGLVNDRIPGELRVGRIDGPGLLAGLRFYDVVVLDPDGQTVVRADSGALSYDWRSFLRRRPVFDNARVWGLDALVARDPGEAAFGIQRAFTSEQPADTLDTGAGMPLEIHGVRIVDGALVIRQPVEGPAAADTRFVTEDVPGGTVRVLTFRAMQAEVGTLLIGGADSRVSVELDALSVAARVLREPFALANARGQVVLRDSVLYLDLPVVELPDSRAGVEGTVTLATEQTIVALNVAARDVALADLGWIDPRIPDEGMASGRLTIAMDTTGTQVTGENLELALDGSRIEGSGGLRTGEPMRFTDVDLTLNPLELATLEPFLDRELPVEGAVTGRITASGTLARLTTRGTLQVRPRGSDRRASVTWNGGLGVEGDPVLRNVDLDIAGLDAAVVAGFVEGLRLDGTIDADVVANGPLARGVTLDGTIRHTLADGSTSTVLATGSIGYDGATRLALDLTLQPFQLQTLGPLSPRLAALRGEATGTLRLEGPIDDLAVTGDLESPAGGIAADVHIAGTATRSFAGSVGLRRVRPAALLPELPPAGATGTVTFDLTGTDPATMSGTLTARLDSASFRRVALGPLRADARIAGGVLHVDTLVADAPGMVLAADGALGLVETSEGTLNVHLTIASLQPLEPFVFEGDPPDPTVPRLDGRGSADVRLAGSIRSFSLDATAALETLTWQEEQLFAIDLSADGAALGSDAARLDVVLAADSAAVMGHETDSTWVRASLENGAWGVSAYAGIGGRDKVALEGNVRTGQDTIAAHLTAFALGDGDAAWRLAEPATILVQGPVVSVDSLRLQRAGGRAGLVAASGRIVRVGDDGVPPETPLDFRASLGTVPLGDLVRFAGIDIETTGNVAGTLRMTGSPDAPIIDGDLAIADFALDDAVLDSLGARVDYASQRLEVRTEAFRGGRRVFFADGRVPIDLRLAETGQRRLAEELDLSFQADSMPARFLLGFVDAMENVEGLLDGQVDATGTTREPRLRGAMSLRQGAATLPIAGVRYRNVTGIFNFTEGTDVAVDLRARAAHMNDPDQVQGSFRVTGSVDVAQPTNPAFDLEIQAQEMLAADRRDMEVVVSGALQLGGAYRAPQLSGQLTVEEGTVNIDELYRQYLVVGLDDPLLFDVVDTTLVSVKRVLPESENPFVTNLRVQDFDVTVLSGSWMRSREMNVEVTGQLNVLFDRQAEDLRLTGTLNTVRGTYRLEYPPIVRTFDVREGTVEFPGTPGVNPNLNVTAFYRVRTQNEPLDIIARVQGTLESPRVTLESQGDVAISQSDLVSYLFLGVPSYAIGSGASSGSGGLGEYGLVTGGLGYLSAGLQTLAQNIGIVDYIGLSAAEPTGTSAGFIQNTQIELGRYLTPELFVVYTQRLGSQNATPDIRLEWRLNDNYTAEVYAEDRFARTPSFGLSQITNARKVFGFLLYRQWSY